MATRLSRFQRVSPALVEQRGSDRHTVSITRATVRAFGEEPTAAMLRDLSSFGCRLMAAAGHDVGERLWLRLGGSLPISATVVWRDQDMVGCRFDKPIERSLVRALTLSAA